MSLMWLESLANAPLHAIACAAAAGFGAAGAAAGAVAAAAAGGVGRGAVAASSPGTGLSAGDTERGAVCGFGLTAGTVCTWRGEICSSGDRLGWFWPTACDPARAAERPAMRRGRSDRIIPCLVSHCLARRRAAAAPARGFAAPVLRVGQPFLAGTLKPG